MSKEFDAVKFIEKYFGIELMEYQKVMIRNMDKYDDHIRGHRLSNQESLCFFDEGRLVDLRGLNTALEPFKTEVQKTEENNG